MLPRHQQHIAKALFRQRRRLLPHFIEAQRHAQDRVIAREPAVAAIIDALIGKIKRREQPDRFAKPLLSNAARPSRQRLQMTRPRRRN